MNGKIAPLSIIPEKMSKNGQKIAELWPFEYWLRDTHEKGASFPHQVSCKLPPPDQITRRGRKPRPGLTGHVTCMVAPLCCHLIEEESSLTGVGHMTCMFAPLRSSQDGEETAVQSHAILGAPHAEDFGIFRST